MKDMYDQQLNRLVEGTRTLGRGLDMASPPRALQLDASSYCLNVRIRSGIVPQAGKVIPGLAIGTKEYSLDEVVRHGMVFPTDVTRFLVLLGTTKAWAVLTGSPIDKTPSTPFSDVVNPRWESDVLLDGTGVPAIIVNNHGNDKPHYWDGSSEVFSPIGNAFLAKTFVGWQGHLLEGNVYDPGTTSWYSNRIEWSALDDFMVWSGITSGNVDLVDTGDPIARLGRLPGNLLAIFRSESVWIGSPTGNYEDILQPQILSTNGIVAPNSLRDIGGGFGYLSKSDVHVCGPSGVEDIGGAIRAELFSKIDEDKYPYVWSYVDKRNKEYYLVTDLKDGTKRAWIFNWDSRTWSMQEADGWSALVTWYEA